jgi:hypothetical protein
MVKLYFRLIRHAKFWSELKVDGEEEVDLRKYVLTV